MSVVPGRRQYSNREIKTDRIVFTRSSDQIWYDEWRNRERRCQYYGDCITCGRRCYGFTDGENDPRGVLGDHAVSMIYASDYDMNGEDVIACFLCQNDYDLYNRGLRLAEKIWQEAKV